MRRSALLAVGIGSAFIQACHDIPTTPLPSPGPGSRQALSARAAGETIPGRYIVRLRDDVGDVDGKVAELRQAHGASVAHVYRHAIKGFSAQLPARAVAALARHPDVLRVTPDRVGSIVGSQAFPPNWGLDRVDQRYQPLNNTYTFYYAGYGVRVYILDTGIRRTHVSFGGRAYTGTDIISPGGNADDCHGHGTHVAGIAGSSTYGVAKNTTLYAVRIVDCGGFGSASEAIAGVDWVTGQKNANPSVPMVANMSVHYGFVQDLNDAVTNSINAGVSYAVAAANDAVDACGDSPGSTPAALTVAASDSYDAFAWFSDFGPCVDVIAPGVAITSAFYTSDYATQTWDGTSMASPHVAGMAALYLDYSASAAPATVHSHIVDNATTGIVAGVPAGTPNRLLYINSLPIPSMPSVTMGGRNSVKPFAMCVWWANVSGGTPPYSYQWTVNGGAVGGNSSEVTYTNNGSNFTIAVNVTDARLNVGNTSKNVTVTSSAQVCPF